MIPKIINYCWFGRGKYPAIVLKCIESWKKYCPDYEIKLWNEDNYDVYKNSYLKEAYESKKWAFVSDFARLDIIYNEGGFYLDTDVELVKSLNTLLDLEGFVSSDEHGINTGVGFGARKNHPMIKKMADLYEGKKFLTPSGPDLTPCTELNTKIFLQYGYTPGCKDIIKAEGITVFPPEYFSPIKGNMSELKTTDNTYAIHWSSLSWETGLTRFKAKLRLKLGLKTINKIKKIFKH